MPSESGFDPQTARRQKWTPHGLHVVYTWSTSGLRDAPGEAWPTPCRQRLSCDMFSTPGRPRPAVSAWETGDGGATIGWWCDLCSLCVARRRASCGKGSQQARSRRGYGKKEKMHPKDCGERPELLECLKQREKTTSLPTCKSADAPFLVETKSPPPPIQRPESRAPHSEKPKLADIHTNISPSCCKQPMCRPHVDQV